MVGLRPGKIDRGTDKPAYTKKSYTRGIPGMKISHFTVGENKPFSHEIALKVKDNCQIRHNALEAARVVSNRWLEKYVGKANFLMKIRVYPHQILRENKMASGKKADRFGEGMGRAFGRPIGNAARVREGQKIISIWVNQPHINAAKEALRKAGMKFPSSFTVSVEKNA
jgi:large subunit ribosomal protein L10e